MRSPNGRHLRCWEGKKIEMKWKNSLEPALNTKYCAVADMPNRPTDFCLSI